MMKLFACAVCFSWCAVMATAQGDKGKGGIKIEGTWTMTGGIPKDAKVTDEAIAALMFVVTFKESKYTHSLRGTERDTGTFKIDAKKKPAHLDLTDGKGNVMLGIVKVDGDVMTVTFANGDKVRPKNFEGVDSQVTILKRGK